MEIIKRHKVKIILLTIIVMLISFAVYVSYHPSNPKYNEKWIIGKSHDEIAYRYGNFVFSDGHLKAYKNDSVWPWISFVDPYFGMHHELLWIEFDENGIAKHATNGGHLGH